MSFSFNFTKNINDIGQLQLYIKSNGFPDLNYINYDNQTYTLTFFFQTNLSSDALNTLQNLINSYPNPLPLNNDIKQISLLNSSNTPLSANSSFTGIFEDISDFSTLSIIINTDTNSSFNGLQAQFSIDGINIDEVVHFNIQAGTPFSQILSIVSRYFRIVYNNSSSNQNIFNLQVMYHKYKPTDNPVVTIKEETGTPTGGNFRSQSFIADIPPNSSQTFDYNWQYPISVIVLKFYTDNTFFGDTFNCLIAPNTTIGFITSDTPSNSNTFNVSPTVIRNCKIGYQCNLFLPYNSTIIDLGDIISIDYANNKVVSSIPVNNNILAGSHFQISINNVRNFVISYPGCYTIGQSKIGTSYLPAGRIIRLVYNNNSSIPKKFIWNMEFLY